MSKPLLPKTTGPPPKPPPPNPPAPPIPAPPPKLPPCWRESLNRCCISVLLIPAKGLELLPEMAMDSVALSGAIPGTGIPAGTMSPVPLPFNSWPSALCVRARFWNPRPVPGSVDGRRAVGSAGSVFCTRESRSSSRFTSTVPFVGLTTTSFVAGAKAAICARTE